MGYEYASVNNSFHSSLVLLTKEDYQEYLCALGTDPGEEPSPVVDELIKNGFLVQEDCDELAIIRHRMYKSRYNTGALGLTIAPTTCCNFRCVYCYEDKIHRDNLLLFGLMAAMCILPILFSGRLPFERLMNIPKTRENGD